MIYGINIIKKMQGFHVHKILRNVNKDNNLTQNLSFDKKYNLKN